VSQPRPLSRRQVIQAATALGVGGTFAAGAAAAPPAFTAGSALVTGNPKPLKYEELPGLLTRAQVAPHYNAHYGGALKRYLAIEQQFDRLFAGKEPAAGDAHVFAVRDRVNKMNSVLLHELYFDGLAPAPPAPRGPLADALNRRFGSVDRWAEDFRTCCLAANGWGILARDAVNGKLYNVASDLHEVGVIWLGQPLVVCDVYEHAFYVDYQNKKADYVANFLKFIDWAEAGRRYQALAR
jgi:Fe-Mn family superoxide dismutase